MPNYENIKNKGFDHRSKEELIEISRRAGKKSGEVRRKRAEFRKTLNLLLTADFNNPEITPILEGMGIESTVEAALLLGQIQQAILGDTYAAKFVAQYSGQTAMSDIEVRDLEADIELKKARKQDITGENENDEALKKLDEILKEVRDNAFKQETE